MVLSMSGLLFIGINGFGILSVIGRNLFPLPPAKIIAFIISGNFFCFLTYTNLYDEFKCS